MNVNSSIVFSDLDWVVPRRYESERTRSLTQAGLPLLMNQYSYYN